LSRIETLKRQLQDIEGRILAQKNRAKKAKYRRDLDAARDALHSLELQRDVIKFDLKKALEERDSLVAQQEALMQELMAENARRETYIAKNPLFGAF
jgi:type VI protein secretion system component VasK